MVAHLVSAHLSSDHIRPFVLHRDLGDLAALIEAAFDYELSLTNSHLARDMRQLALWGPMLRIVKGAVPLFSGYVWIEQGQMVGNASFSPGKEEGSWVLSNVAVLPAYRGRGIAGELVDAAIARIRHGGGKRILLQVRADNQVAHALYAHRGFATYDTAHEMEMPGGFRPTYGWLVKPELRGVRASDSRALYRLVVASTPGEVLRRHPVRPREFSRSLWQLMGRYLSFALGGQERLELVGEDMGTLVVYGRLFVYLFRPYELQLHVLPSQRGQWESPLAQNLLSFIHRGSSHGVRASVSSSHPEALVALEELGFKTLRVLDHMSLEIQ